MTVQEAIDVLERLAGGVHPVTGEALDPDGPLADYVTLRALRTVIQHLRPSSAQAGPAKAGSGWSAEEDRQLVREFNAGIPCKIIAENHQRTQGAIQSRLVKLGLVESVPRPQPLPTTPALKPWVAASPTRAGKPWSPEEDQALREGLRQGVSIEALASSLKRGVYAVEVRCAKLGMKPAER